MLFFFNAKMFSFFLERRKNEDRFNILSPVGQKKENHEVNSGRNIALNAVFVYNLFEKRRSVFMYFFFRFSKYSALGRLDEKNESNCIVLSCVLMYAEESKKNCDMNM